MRILIVVVHASIVGHAHVEVGWILPAEAEGPADVAGSGNEDGHSYRPSMRTNIGCLLSPVTLRGFGITACVHVCWSRAAVRCEVVANAVSVGETSARAEYSSVSL